MGLHRYFAHRSFKTSKTVEWALLIFASLNCFGSPMTWVGVHRLHHQHSDTNDDPHGGDQPWWRVWLTMWRPFKVKPRLVADMIRDPKQKFFYNHYFKLLFVTFCGLALIDIWIPVFLISIPAVITFHSAGLVNSVCHLSGYRSFDTKDKSYNNLWVNFLTLGSGLHNNHHAHPKSYFNSYRWYEIDVPGLVIHYLLRI